VEELERSRPRVAPEHEPIEKRAAESPKVHRALTGLADDDPDLREWPADHDGSAKFALIGIDRSHAAWLQAGVTSHADVQPFIADLIWLGDALERVFSEGSRVRAAGSR
jgi:hypothetical protein